jgi:hypothetical protein
MAARVSGFGSWWEEALILLLKVKSMIQQMLTLTTTVATRVDSRTRRYGGSS